MVACTTSNIWCCIPYSVGEQHSYLRRVHWTINLLLRCAGWLEATLTHHSCLKLATYIIVNLQEITIFRGTTSTTGSGRKWLYSCPPPFLMIKNDCVRLSTLVLVSRYESSTQRGLLYFDGDWIAPLLFQIFPSSFFSRFETSLYIFSLIS